MLRRSPFFYVAGKCMAKPPILARIQTDGSYYHAYRFSRTAVILQAEDEYKLMKTYMEGEHLNSTESEWASVLDGLIFADTKGQGAVELENDNLGVIRAIKDSRAKKEMDRYYLHAIRKQAHEMEWVAVRWIPRELNRADDLFQLTPQS